MSEWFTLRALAQALCQPGKQISSEKRRLRDIANRKKWHCRKVPGTGLRGGPRVEYHVTNLTEAQRDALAKYEARGAVAAASKRPDEGATPGGEASDGAAAGAIARPTLAEIAEVENTRSGLWQAFERGTSRKKQSARDRHAAVIFISDLVEAGTPKGTARAKAIEKFGISDSTLRDWLSRVKGIRRDDWLPALIDGYCGRPRGVGYDPRVFEYFKSDYMRSDRPPAMASFRRAITFMPEDGVPLGVIPKSVHTLLRRLRAEIPWQAIRFSREGATALHRTYPAQRRDRSVFRALECVNGDGYRWNVAVLWPDGEICRPVMWHWQDTYSSKILAWRIGKTESADLVRLATGDLVGSAGLVDLYVVDNTLAAASKSITGRAPGRFRFRVTDTDVLGLLLQLGGQVIYTLPRIGGSSKPCERAGGDYDRDIARHPAFDGAWLGTDSKTRPEEARKPIPLETFLEVVGEGIRAHNLRTGRRGPIANGRSFDEVYRESYEKSVIRKATAEQLRLCLLAAEKIKCSSRDGTVQLFGNVYYAESVAALAGQCLVVRFDPQKLQQSVYVYTLDGCFIDEAPCRLAVGFVDRAAAREHNRLRRQNLKRFKDIARNERTMSALHLAAALPVSPDPEPLSSKVVAMFRSKIASPIVAAASGADEYQDDPPADAGELRRREYERLKKLAPQLLSEHDRQVIRVFEDSSDYRALQMFGVIAS